MAFGGLRWRTCPDRVLVQDGNADAVSPLTANDANTHQSYGHIGTPFAVDVLTRIDKKAGRFLSSFMPRILRFDHCGLQLQRHTSIP